MKSLAFILVLVVSSPCVGADKLSAAVRAGNVAEVKVALAADPSSINRNDATGIPPLLVAVSLWPMNVEIVRLLLNQGANVRATTPDGETALHIASLKGQLEIAQQIIEQGADVNSKDGHGRTPLDEAAVTGQEKVARLLVRRGASMTAFDAALLGWTPELLKLCQANPQLLKDRQFGLEPIILAATKGRTETARAMSKFYPDQDIFEATAAENMSRLDQLLASSPTLVNSSDTSMCTRKPGNPVPG